MRSRFPAALLLPLPLLLTLAAARPAAADEPKATITGPTTAVVGAPVLLDLGGSASDPEFPLQVEVAGDSEFKPQLRVWLDSVSTKPGLAVLVAPRPGQYTVVVVAIGKPANADKAVTRIAAWPVEITPIPPAPEPPPAPGPGPTPGPTPPPPAPVPPVVAGKLWAVLVVPDLPSQAEAALRTSPTIRATMVVKGAFFRSYLASESEIATPAWKAAIAAAGTLPAVVWITEDKHVVKVTPAATEPAILADLKALKGGN
jgi:hypothetical protein